MKYRYILLMVLVAILIVAPASAWLSGFQYERDMIITSTYPITLTSYQVKVIFYNTTGISNGQNCYLNGSITQPTTWNDLRVTTTTDAICDMWIQETNATAAIVWVEVPYIYTGETRLRVYTDKPVATAVSDGDATFRFWGTFQVVPLNVDKWVGAGNYTLYTQPDGTTVADIKRNATSGESSITSIDTFAYATGYEQVMRASMTRWPQTTIGVQSTTSMYANFEGSGQFNNSYSTETRLDDKNKHTDTNIGASYTGWHIWKIKRDQSGASVLFTVDNVVVATHTTNVPTVAMPLSFRSIDVNGEVIVDWAFVKKYVDPEPTITAWGAPTVEGNPNTQFEAQPRFGSAGTTVYFYDLTTGVHSGWAWTFGDGATSTLQNPNHTYANVGTYNVSMSTSNVNGTDVQFEQNYILITGAIPTPTTTTGKVPVMIAAVMMVGIICLTIYFMIDNERMYASVFAAIMGSVLSFLVGWDFLFVGITELSSGVSFTYYPQPEGYFFIMVGIMLSLLVLAIIVDTLLKRGKRS